MATRAIGIDYDGKTLRLVALQAERGRRQLLHHAATAWDGREPLAEVLLRRLGVLPVIGDRVAAALPPAIGYTRRLSFPFSDRRKLAAAIPLELASQLPVAVDDCVIDQLEAQLAGNAATVIAAAVPASAVAAAVAPFDQAAIPLQVVDLLPAVLAATLSDLYGEGLALYVAAEWGLLLWHSAAGLEDYRLIPLQDEADGAGRAARIAAALAPVQRTADAEARLRLCGPAADDDLLAALCTVHPQTLRERELAVGGGATLPADFLPAFALAQRSLAPAGRGGFNFRRGAFARHGEWEVLQRRLLLLGGLLATAVLILALSCGLRWWGKGRIADGLKADLVKIYRDAVPGEGAVVDVPLQLRARLAELTRSSRPGGQHPALTPLAVMREVAALTPGDLRVTVREWEHSGDEVRLAASVPAFDVADRLTTALAASPLFRSVRIVDSQSSADSSRVDLQLLITLQPAEGLP